jgi:hypothetical protein
MSRKGRYYTMCVLAFAGLSLSACDDMGSLSSVIEPTPNVARLLDSLAVSFIEGQAQHDEMPVILPGHDMTWGRITIELHNTSMSSEVDTLLFGYGILYLSATGEQLVRFTLSNCRRVGAADWNGSMGPGQRDTVQCWFNFAHDQVPCNDSIFVDLQILNRYGDSLAVRTHNFYYQCTC